MGQFRTSSLFHYTKSIDILHSILINGLIPNYCYEDLSYKTNTSRGIGIPMVSFCDIPLSKTNLFVERYGKYAIGLTKKWANNKRINPILYAKDDNILISLGFYKSIEQSFTTRLKEHGGNKNQITFDLTHGPKPQIADFFNSKNAHSANVSIHGMVKKYYGEYEGNIQINYEENEWRYIIEDTDITPWFWNKEEYNKWRGNKNTPKPVPTKFLCERKLQFDINDVAFILVSEEIEVPFMVNLISQMSSISGHKISNDEKKLLYTRILSFERIRQNF